MKEKKKFTMPHLFWILMGLLLLVSLLTYIIPAGNFAVDENGNILSDQFFYLGHQTPVSPWQTMMLVLEGLSSSGSVIWVVLCSGATTAIMLATGAIDNLLNWATYKLRNKSDSILISILFILMVYLGGFGGTDGLIAMVPIGVIFAKKLKLDPICAIGVTSFATLMGFGTGPTRQAVMQMLMGVKVYGAFFTMFLSMNFFMVLSLFFLLRYVKKIRKDPEKSLMYSEGWRPDVSIGDAENGAIKETTLSMRSVTILAIYICQYLLIITYSFMGGTKLYPFIVAVNLSAAILIGLIGKFSFNKIGEEYSKGVASVAFIGFAIGMAKVVSLVLTNGNILHTIVYTLTLPLMNLPRSVASIGMTAVIAVVNIVIPSATSKAAIFAPILRPMADALNMAPELAVQAFQYGDGFVNLVSPFIGWTVGSCVMAEVPFTKWVKWALPKVLLFLALSFGIMVLLTESNWVPI